MKTIYLFKHKTKELYWSTTSVSGWVPLIHATIYTPERKNLAMTLDTGVWLKYELGVDKAS